MKKMIFLVGTITVVIGLMVARNQKKNKVVYNWAKNLVCHPEKIFYPSSKQELSNIIKNAYHNKKTIRAVGTNHSWSPIACAEYLVNMDKLNKILKVDKSTQEVQVEAGIKIYELNEKLEKIGLNLPNQSFTQSQSLFGNIATGTHGSGNTGTFASFITALELVMSDGSIKKISAQENLEEFAAAGVSFGCLGIVYSVTLLCVPAFNVVSSTLEMDWSEASQKYQELIKKHDFVQISWNPKTGKATIYIKDTANLHENTTSDASGPSYIILTGATYTTDPSIYFEEEISIPVEHLPAAVNDLEKLIKKYTGQKFNAQDAGYLFRFVKTDKQSYLSPTALRESVFISITTDSINKEFFKEFEDLMMQYQGRPHWGKMNFLNNKKVKNLYGENFDKFNKIRKQFDPNNLYLNKYTKQIFDILD